MQQIFVSKIFELYFSNTNLLILNKRIYIVSLLRVTYGIISIFFKKKKTTTKTLSSSCKREKLRNIVHCLEEIRNSSIRFLKRIITVLKNKHV